MSLYLLHFDPPYQHARHYLGFTKLQTEKRIKRHVEGHGSPLIRAAIRAGSTVELTRVWPDPEGTRLLERKLKNGHGSVRLCPVCRPAFLAARRASRSAVTP